MDKSHSPDWVMVHETADKFYRESPDKIWLSDEQVHTLDSTPAEPSAMAYFARFAIGNNYRPIESTITAARMLNINVIDVPIELQDKVPAYGVWFHNSPVLLVGEAKTKAKFNHAVATEIGKILLARPPKLEGVKGRRLENYSRDFADQFLYPDSAALALKESKSRQLLVTHKQYFDVDSATILRRLHKAQKL